MKNAFMKIQFSLVRVYKLKKLIYLHKLFFISSNQTSQRVIHLAQGVQKKTTHQKHR